MWGIGSKLHGKIVFETQNQTFMPLCVTDVHDCLFKIVAGSFIANTQEHLEMSWRVVYLVK